MDYDELQNISLGSLLRPFEEADWEWKTQQFIIPEKDVYTLSFGDYDGYNKQIMKDELLDLLKIVKEEIEKSIYNLKHDITICWICGGKTEKQNNRITCTECKHNWVYKDVNVQK